LIKLLHFADAHAEITWLDANDSIDEILKIVLESPYSRFPVSRKSLDNVLGILTSKSLMGKAVSHEPYNIVDLLEKPLFVPENTPAMRVLELERELGVHEALVIDENDRPVETALIGDEPCYLINYEGFLRHVPSRPIDLEILKSFGKQIEGNEVTGFKISPAIHNVNPEKRKVMLPTSCVNLLRYLQ